MTHATSRCSIGNISLWLALGVAFSPAVVDLGAHWWARPWARYSLIFLPLLVWSIARERPTPPRRGHGLLLIGFGALVQLIAAGGGIPAASRPALAFGIIGLILLRGLASPRCALLALWVVPVPYAIVSALGGAPVASVLFRGALGLLAPFDFDLVLAQRTIASGHQELRIDPAYGGLPLLVLATGLAWNHMLRRDLSLGAAWGTLARFVFCAAATQVAAVVSASAALAAGSQLVAAAILGWAWVVAAAVMLGATEREHRRARLVA